MDKQEIELIKKMVIHGCYKVCIINGYNSTIFSKLKEEQERVFANYILNKVIAEKRDKFLLEDWENINVEEID